MKELSKEELEEITKKVGLPRNEGKKIHLDMEKVIAMLNAGFSKPQVAKYFGVCVMTIKRRLEDRYLS